MLAQMHYHRSQCGDPQWRPTEVWPIPLAAEEGMRASEGSPCTPVRGGVFPRLMFLLQSDACKGQTPSDTRCIACAGEKSWSGRYKTKCVACPFLSSSRLSRRRAPTAFPGTGSSPPRGTAGPRLFQSRKAAEGWDSLFPGLLVKHIRAFPSSLASLSNQADGSSPSRLLN